MSEYEPELVERMVALTRAIAAKIEQTPPFEGMVAFINGVVSEAKHIVRELPELVDPDLTEARELVSCERIGYGVSIRNGTAYQERVEAVMLGIKRGRELATPATSA